MPALVGLTCNVFLWSVWVLEAVSHDTVHILECFWVLEAVSHDAVHFLECFGSGGSVTWCCAHSGVCSGSGASVTWYCAHSGVCFGSGVSVTWCYALSGMCLGSGGSVTWYCAHSHCCYICVCCVIVALQKEAQRALKHHQTFSPGSIPPSWSFQILPTLYQHYQKVETISKHSILF
jgi:hypothetical protein